MTDKPMQTLDLSMREGIVTYIESMLLKDVLEAFKRNGTVQPYGIALGTVQNGAQLPRPQAMGIGSFGMDLRIIKKSLRKLAQNSKATGTILVSVVTLECKGTTREDKLALVQLEHPEFGDTVWSALVTRNNTVGDFTPATALADATHKIPKTKFMPGRWMH